MDRVENLINWLEGKRFHASLFGLSVSDLDYILRELSIIKMGRD